MQPRFIKNYNLIVDGFGHMGLCSSVTIPDMAHITDQHRSGGMDSAADVEFGLEQLVLNATVSERSENLQVLVGRTNQNSVAFQLRAALTADTGTETPYLISGRGMMRRVGGGDIAAGAKHEMEIEMSLRYYRLVQGDREIYEIDIDNFVRRIDGVDQLAARRAILLG